MDSCKPHFKTLGMLTLYSIYILESTMFLKNNQDLLETNRYHLNETRNRNELEKILHRSSCFVVFKRTSISIKCFPTK